MLQPTTTAAAASCPLCRQATAPEVLEEAAWYGEEVAARLLAAHPDWRRPDGACPACVQEALLESLPAGGERLLGERVQSVWPLDPEAAFGAIPTPLRMRADPRFTGRGVTLALIDSAFHPHPDLVEPVNAVRAWVDASREPVEVRRFAPGETPGWPGSDRAGAAQWHGLMTSAVAAGRGTLSHGLYRGLASASDLVLIQVAGADGRIRDAGIARALEWLVAHGRGLGVRVASLSLGADAEAAPGNPIDAAVSRLVAAGVVVTAAAGNDGVRRLVPPATARDAVTVGGLDDRNTLAHEARVLWHGNYGGGGPGEGKPEVVAPSIWVVAPLLPGTAQAVEARELFARRAASVARGLPEPEANARRIAAARLVTPDYQHVEGTSFAAPLAAGVAACMLEANPGLRPAQVRQALVATATRVPGAAAERQGAGAIDAGRAVAMARAESLAGDHHAALALA